MSPKCQTQQSISLKTRDHCPACFIFLIYGPLSTYKKVYKLFFPTVIYNIYIYVYTWSKINKSLKVYIYIFFHDLKDLNNALVNAVTCAVAEPHFMILSYKLFMRGLPLIDSWNKNVSCTFMLRVYDDRLFLPQNWKLPSQFIKSVDKNSAHTKADSFTKQPKPTQQIFNFPNKIRKVLLHEKYV